MSQRNRYPHYPEFSWYLERVLWAFRTTRAGGKIQLTWCSPELDAEGWRDEFQAALDRRISGRMPHEQRGGRKFSDEYQTNIMRDAHDLALRAAGVRVYSLRTPELRTRLRHLLSSYDD